MTVDELTAAVREANHSKTWPSLVERMRQLEEGELFRLLFPLATSGQWECPMAFSAALLLHEIKPACLISCKEALRGLFGNWDVSIEEVPWYLQDLFGRQRVLEVIQEMLREPLTDQQKSRLGQSGIALALARQNVPRGSDAPANQLLHPTAAAIRFSGHYASQAAAVGELVVMSVARMEALAQSHLEFTSP